MRTPVFDANVSRACAFAQNAAAGKPSATTETTHHSGYAGPEKRTRTKRVVSRVRIVLRRDDCGPHACARVLRTTWAATRVMRRTVPALRVWVTRVSFRCVCVCACACHCRLSEFSTMSARLYNVCYRNVWQNHTQNGLQRYDYLKGG